MVEHGDKTTFKEVTVLRKLYGEKAEPIEIIATREGINCLIGEPNEKRDVDDCYLFTSEYGQLIAKHNGKGLISLYSHEIVRYKELLGRLEKANERE